MTRHSLLSILNGDRFLLMIFSILTSVFLVNCFFVQYAYSSLHNQYLADYFGKKVGYLLTSSGEYNFVLHYVVSGGFAGSLRINNENISYNSRTNELSGNCGKDFLNKHLSDSVANNLELMVYQNKDFMTNRDYSSSQNAADRFNYNLTVTNDGREHYSTWTRSTDIPTNLSKIAKEIHRIACNS